MIQFDKTKFVSENAQNRSYDSMSNQNLIAERGLCVTRINWPTITANIRERKWDNFCAQPQAAIVPVVREFYANVPEHHHRMVFVRGKQVGFSGHAINVFFNLPDIENDDYTAFLGGEIDYQEVLRTIVVPSTQWKMLDDKPVTFPSIGLTRECKAWYYFLAVRLVLVRHFNDINKERVVLLYSIVIGKSLYLGKFLSSHIIQCAKH